MIFFEIFLLPHQIFDTFAERNDELSPQALLYSQYLILSSRTRNLTKSNMLKFKPNFYSFQNLLLCNIFSKLNINGCGEVALGGSVTPAKR